MDLEKIVGSILVGAVLGGAATFYTLNERLTKVETKQQDLERRIGIVETQPKVASNKSEKKTEKPTILFHEPFDSNTLGWGVGENSRTDIDGKTYTVKSRINNGKYYFENKGNLFLGTSISLSSLSLNYDIELVSQWIFGDKDSEFGLSLALDGHTYYFEVTKNGYARVRWIKAGYWQSDPIPFSKGGFGNHSSRIFKQVIKVRGDEFNYFVNDKLIGKGYFDEVDFKTIGVVVNNQEIAFDRLTILEIKSN